MRRETMVSMAIKRLSNQMKRVVEHTVGPPECQPLTAMQRFIIGYLMESSKAGVVVYQRDLEDEFTIRRSTVTGILKLMEKNNLIRRIQGDSDARLKRLELTEEAKNAYQKVDSHMKTKEEKIIENLSDEEIESFLTIADKIYKNLEHLY